MDKKDVNENMSFEELLLKAETEVEEKIKESKTPKIEFKTFIEETQLHEMFLDYINPKGAFEQQLKSLEVEEDRVFKNGVMTGIALFLIHVSVNAKKYISSIEVKEDIETEGNFKV